jgi:polyhydroxybutyrate depolymerase
MSKLALMTIFSIFCVGLSQQASAEGVFRERIKEAIKERMASKSSDNIYEISQGGITRKYMVHVPPSYKADKPTPLVVAFHGGGGHMEHMAKDEAYGLISKSNKEGFIVAFPNGYSKFGSGKFATWYAGNCCGDARDKKIDDVGFIRKMVGQIEGKFNIDTQKIYATGMSNGGMISYVAACELSDVFKAIAAVAGTDNTVSCSHKSPVSVLHIHAQNDTHVLFNGGAGEGSFNDVSKVTDFTSVQSTIERWVGYNQCQAKPKRVLTVNGAYCDLYDECAGGSQVKLCVTDTGGHSWPGGHKNRGEPTSQAISANDVMWDFFKSLK